jgi:hypothetical protein
VNVIVGRRHRIRVFTLRLILGVLLVIAAGIAVAAAADLPLVIDVAADGGLLTVDVRNAPLAQVLRTVAERAGIEITVRGDVSAPVTLTFAALPLEEAIRRIARGYPLAFTYAAPADDSAPAVMTAVWVMERSATTAGAVNAANESRPSFIGAEPTGRGGPEATSELAVAPRPGKIQRLAGDADHGNEVALSALAEMVSSDADADVRRQAVAALGRLARPALEPLLTAALTDADVDVRLGAVRGLRRFGTETAVASLATTSTGDADPGVRFAALSALMSFPGQTMVQGLVRAAADPDGRVRDAAARGLAWWWNVRRSGAP